MESGQHFGQCEICMLDLGYGVSGLFPFIRGWSVCERKICGELHNTQPLNSNPVIIIFFSLLVRDWFGVINCLKKTHQAGRRIKNQWKYAYVHLLLLTFLSRVPSGVWLRGSNLVPIWPSLQLVCISWDFVGCSQETESGFVRGAAVGAISGTLFSTEVFKSFRVLWHSEESRIGRLLYLIDVIVSLVSGRLVTERIGTAMLSAVQSQVSSSEVSFEDGYLPKI